MKKSSINSLVVCSLLHDYHEFCARNSQNQKRIKLHTFRNQQIQQTNYIYIKKIHIHRETMIKSISEKNKQKRLKNSQSNHIKSRS